MKHLPVLTVLLSAMLVAGCGGGGGSSGTSVFGGDSTDSSGSSGSSASTTSAILSLTLSSTTVTTASPATVTVVAKDSSGNVLPGVVVAFSTTAGSGVFNVASALTDAAGVASVTLSPASATSSGADTITAAATIDGTTVTSTKGYSLTPASIGIGSFSTDVGASSSSKLSAYGQAVLTLSMSGVSTSNPATVTFTSPCITSGKATISSSSVTNTTGTITQTYEDNGCGATNASDVVTATLSSGVSSSVTVYPASPTANAVSFVTASPSSIYLKGSGLTESSTVTFQVNDGANNPLPNQMVTLSLTTFTGGLLLDGGSGAITKTTDSNGKVSVLVSAGTVPTPVRVKASLASGVTTVSSSLAVAVGLPTEVAFSLSQKTINIEGGSVDGTANTYTIYAADRSGNPVPANTAVTFWAEGGQVVGSALTTLSTSGLASATAAFVSQEPRPDDGRVTVVAYAIGEESFIDLNGNNAWDAGEPFQDLGDVVKDILYDGNYDGVYDEFVSLSGTQSAGTSACSDYSSTYSKLAVTEAVPSRANTCDATWTQRTYVRRAVETVLSTSSSRLLWASSSQVNGSCPSVELKYSSSASSIYRRVASGSSWYNSGSTGSISFIVADANNVRLNPMAAGTKITVSGANGLTATVLGGSPVASTATATAAAISYKFDDGVTSGSFTLNVESPSGLTTSYVINVRNTATTPSCS